MTSPVKLKLSLGSRSWESTPNASCLAPKAAEASSELAVLTLGWHSPIKRDVLELQQEAECPILSPLQEFLPAGADTRGWLGLAGTAQSRAGAGDCVQGAAGYKQPLSIPFQPPSSCRERKRRTLSGNDLTSALHPQPTNNGMTPSSPLPYAFPSFTQLYKIL